MSIAKIGLGILFGGAALVAQDPARLSFEVASIRPSASTPQQGVAAGARIDGAQFRTAFLTLKDYIAMAYRLKLYQISGPDWIGSDRFDIAAKLPEGTLPSQTMGMMQTLLEERFQLKSHREKKEFPVYALEIAKGGFKMTESPQPRNWKTWMPERHRLSRAQAPTREYPSISARALPSLSLTINSRRNGSAWRCWSELWNAFWTGR